ncbi:MAG: glycosyltransferase family 2 protein [Bacteroidaceae bacterium]|nr:glycosyltransferase family 2 protein [Bacteroidaceae bacterium]
MHNYSVIIPHHNIPALLQRCLDSIPPHDDMQVIVVDDNSSPQTVDFRHFPGLERPDVEVVLDKQGGGAGHARNVGIEHADGTWLIFADADDYFVPDFYETISSYVDSESDLILFMADSVDSDTGEPSDRHLVLNENVRRALKGEMTVRQASLEMPTPWCRMVRRSFVMERGIRYDEIPVSNDTMFAVKATCWARQVEVCDRVLYIVTTRRGSLWDGNTRDPRNFLCRLEVYIRRNRFYRDYPYAEKKAMMLFLLDAWPFGLATVWRAFCMLVRSGMLFSGMGTFWKIVRNHLSRK